MSVNPAIETAAPAVPLKARFGGWGTGLMLAGVWLALIVATALYRPDFLSHQTLLAVTFTMAVVGVLAIGQGLVAISGGFIDLSQPAGLILTGLVAVPFDQVDAICRDAKAKQASEEKTLAGMRAGKPQDRSWVDATLKRLGCEIEGGE